MAIADPEPFPGPRHRRMWGAILGAMGGAAVGWGVAGGWDQVYLADVPFAVDTTKILIVTLGAGSGCLLIGLLVSLPKHWEQALRMLAPILVGAPFLCTGVAMLNDSQLPEATTGALVWYALFNGLCLFLSGGLLALATVLVMRGVLGIVTQAAWLGPLERIIATEAACAVIVGLGLAASWAPDQIGEELTHRRVIYRAVDEAAKREGWRIERLEALEYPPILYHPDLPFKYGSVLVVLSSGDAIRCTIYPDQRLGCQ